MRVIEYRVYRPTRHTIDHFGGGLGSEDWQSLVFSQCDSAIIICDVSVICFCGFLGGSYHILFSRTGISRL